MLNGLKKGKIQTGNLIEIGLDTGKERRYIIGDEFIGIHLLGSGMVGN